MAVVDVYNSSLQDCSGSAANLNSSWWNSRKSCAVMPAP